MPRLSRRRVVGVVATGSIASLAGCSDGPTNVVDDGETIPMSAASDVLIDLSQLPEPEEDRGEWEVAYEKSTGEQWNSRVAADVTYTVPWEQKLSSDWRYLANEIHVYDSIEAAKEQYQSEYRVFDDDSNMETDDLKMADEAFFSEPNTGADDTHLQFRENNIWGKFVEMEGWSGADEVVKSAAKTLVGENIPAP